MLCLGIDGKKYIDISLMGVGTNILGYANSKIDREVNKNIKSNMSTLNCPEEVYLIEKIRFHPWFQMGKLTRSGGLCSNKNCQSCTKKEVKLLYVDTMGGMVGTTAGD